MCFDNTLQKISLCRAVYTVALTRFLLDAMQDSMDSLGEYDTKRIFISHIINHMLFCSVGSGQFCHTEGEERETREKDVSNSSSGSTH